MDKKVVRRGIGAVVLALIAALLLGYLLKSKNDEGQDVAELKTAVAPIQIFPNDANGQATLVDGSTLQPLSQNGVDSTANAVDGTTEQLANGTQGVVQRATDGAAAMTGQLADTAGTVTNTAADGVSATTDMLSNAGQAATNAATTQFAIRPEQVAKAPDNTSANAAAEAVIVSTDKATTDKVASVTSKASSSASANKKAEKIETAKANVATRTETVRKNRLQATPNVSKKSANIKLVGEKRLPAIKPGVRSAKKDKAPSTDVAAASQNSGKDKATDSNAVIVANSGEGLDAAATDAAGRNRYVIQLVATSNKARAVEIYKTMHSEGYQSFVSNTMVNGKQIFRVRIGNFANRNVALSMQEKMKRRYRQNSYIQASVLMKN